MEVARVLRNIFIFGHSPQDLTLHQNRRQKLRITEQFTISAVLSLPLLIQLQQNQQLNGYNFFFVKAFLFMYGPGTM
jgi:hypothetical protein